jgi:RNA polymerase sigma-70 factor, ECF subfamily
MAHLDGDDQPGRASCEHPEGLRASRGVAGSRSIQDRHGPGGRTPETVVAEWFDLHVDAVHRYVARRVGAQTARDVVADTFRIALERFGDYDPARGTERSWLFGIATNLVRRHWRTEERRLRTHSTAAGARSVPGDPLLDVEDALDARRRLDRLIDAVCRLSVEDRDLLVLVAWEGLSATEVSAVLGIPKGTVRSRLSRARSQLRTLEALEHIGGHDG